MADEYVELTGDDLPYHLRRGALPLATCDRCGRVSWDESVVGALDTMTQPDGSICGGHFKEEADRD